MRKISPLPVFDPLTVQPVANSYTDPPINIVVTSNLKIAAVGSRTGGNHHHGVITHITTTFKLTFLNKAGNSIKYYRAISHVRWLNGK
jgi:hypothetical protein